MRYKISDCSLVTRGLGKRLPVRGTGPLALGGLGEATSYPTPLVTRHKGHTRCAPGQGCSGRARPWAGSGGKKGLGGEPES